MAEGEAQAGTRGLRALDVVVFGATGYTGRLIAQYLAVRAPKLRIALAGRSAEKLHAVRATLPAAWAEIPLIVCAGDNKPALATMAVQTSIVINAAGPFATSGGENVIEVCINNLAHYVDTTGETDFYRRVVDRFHERARATGVCIIPACGLDSLPWDLSAFAAVHDRSGAVLPSVDKVELFGEVRFKPSAGTVASALEVFRKLDLLGEFGHLWSAWVGVGGVFPSMPRVKLYPHYSHAIRGWVMPLPILDSTVARRSLNLVARRDRDAPPPDVHLAQYTVLRTAFAPIIIIVALFAVVPLLVLVGKIAFLRKAVLKWLRTDGHEGPTDAERAAGSLRLTAIASHTGKGPAASVRQIVNVTASDPAYGTTAKWISEVALMLLQVPVPASAESGVLAGTGGVLTPASAFGFRLLELLHERKIMTVS